MRTWISLTTLPLLAIGVCASAQDIASSFPDRPIRFVSPFAPGGATDPLARLIGHGFTESWKQPVILDNRPGGGPTITTDVVKTVSPDAHTVLIVAASFAINPSLYKNANFGPVRDFAPIVAVLNSASVRQRILDTGVEPWLTSPEKAKEFIAAETSRWSKVISRLSLKPDRKRMNVYHHTERFV